MIPVQLVYHRSRADGSFDGNYLSFTLGVSLYSRSQLRWITIGGYIPVSPCFTWINTLREPGNCQLSGSKVSNLSSYPTRLRLGNPKPRLFHRTLILRISHNSRGDRGMNCGRRRWRRQLISLRSYLVMSLDYSLGWDVLVSNSSGTQVHPMHWLY